MKILTQIQQNWLKYQSGSFVRLQKVVSICPQTLPAKSENNPTIFGEFGESLLWGQFLPYQKILYYQNCDSGLTMALTDYIVKIKFVAHHLMKVFTKFQMYPTGFGEILVYEHKMLS